MTPPPWEYPQPALWWGPPGLLWANPGGVTGPMTDVPVPKLLTPSREPSAYTEVVAPPRCIWRADTPVQDPQLSGHTVWGKECQFSFTLALPSCMALVLVGPLAHCMPPLATPPILAPPSALCSHAATHPQLCPVPPSSCRGTPTSA